MPHADCACPPRVRDLAVDYTALSLAVPEKVRFRFKLEGQDQDWREVVNQRRVEYSNLLPRNYRFRVTASNNDGVWNTEGASLDFSIAPAYYQTNWFRALCVAAFLALLWALYQLRIRQLQEQERKLRDAIETIPTAAWVSRPDGSIEFVNRRWMEYTGLSTAETVGSGWQVAVHPEDMDRHVAKWGASLARGEPFEDEARYRHAADGGYRWFLVRAVPLRNARGKIVKWYGTSTDVEDHKRAEQELRRSEAWLAEAQAMTHTGSFVWDIRTRHAVYLSDEWYLVFGFDPEKDKDRAWEERWQRVHPEDRPRWKAAVERGIKEKCNYELEERLVLPDGSIKYLHIIGHRVANPSGDVVQFMGSVTDITARRRAEDALRRSEGYLTEAQRLTHTGSWAGDGKSREIMFWSGEMCRIFGLDSRQGLPTRDQVYQRIHPEDRDKVKLASDRMYREKVELEVEYRIVLPDGTVKHIHALGHPVLSANGELIETLGTIVDVTERKRAEEERERLRQLEADLAYINRVSMMGELAASLAHELK
jgi:PAS domain S-box-containing protein